jgi:D-sedoheptulose 7-phosphate isomerase|tara:strand:+ start:64 stop:624 length:561 start_codon:yes stop_codon:yes gene_type:complete
MKAEISEMIDGSLDNMVKVRELMPQIEKAAKIMIDSLKNGNKIMACGNGGSAAQAMHFSGELMGKFLVDRKPLASVCLNSDITNMTAIGNDYGYEQIYRRQVEGIGRKGDVLVCFTTSGNSENLVQAVKNIKGIKVINLLGGGGGKMKDRGDVDIVVDSDDTPRIQECHLLILHILAKLIEDEFVK